ncbi:hypothetical protein [Ruegeria atlantica]|uniref:hypothetical protein n=1 Tax=Ruegeria atlantica TaxID=81569 RepID=UPI0024949147|nr:hypothetical protein [Ruegeria atlantica]
MYSHYVSGAVALYAISLDTLVVVCPDICPVTALAFSNADQENRLQVVVPAGVTGRTGMDVLAEATEHPSGDLHGVGITVQKFEYEARRLNGDDTGLAGLCGSLPALVPVHVKRLERKESEEGMDIFYIYDVRGASVCI